MQHINFLFKKECFTKKAWLIIGKGPSFAKMCDHNLADYHTFGLNHVIKEVGSLDIMHLIDVEVLETCADDIYNKAKYLCMPINPHFNNKPSHISLKNLIKTNPVLKKLSEEKRLFWYNHLSRSRGVRLNNINKIFYKKVPVKYFSAEVPFQILGMNNISQIYSIGIDGGTVYENRFYESAKLPGGRSTLLSNGRCNFDIQFTEIIKSINQYNLTYTALNSDSPIKVYVGSQEEQMLSVKVLEYSIKKRTSSKVEVFPLHNSNIDYPTPKDKKNRQRTPFSFQRFLIPELNNFSGRAIYLDSDMLVLQDINGLWNLPMSNSDVFSVDNTGSKSKKDSQFSVMLLDCDKLSWSIRDIVKMLDNGELSYDSLMSEMAVAKNVSSKISYRWNCLEWYKKNDSALVHFTNMPTQPWVSTKNKLCTLWMQELIDAVSDGFISLDMIKDHIKKGWVRPSIVYQVENNIPDSYKLPQKALLLDKDFIPPYISSNHQVSSGFIEDLTNTQLGQLNEILPWQCFTVDKNNRYFGRCVSKRKRVKPQVIPDKRILLMDKKFKLKGKTVLEVGCFEGIHTIGLCMTGAVVDAVDVRMVNVVKTIVRVNMFGYSPKVYIADIEDKSLLSFDFIHHVGVFYHLKDPVSHLLVLGKMTRKGLMLDTHYCQPDQANKSYVVNNVSYPYYYYKEFGEDDIYSGAYDHAKWLTLDSIKSILMLAGFDKVEVDSVRKERHGERCLIFASKTYD